MPTDEHRAVARAYLTWLCEDDPTEMLEPGCIERLAEAFAEREAAAENREQARTQSAVLACLERLVGADNVRGGDGCDSGDPLDWTVAAISLTVTRWGEQREAAARARAVEEALSAIRARAERYARLTDIREAFGDAYRAIQSITPDPELVVVRRAALDVLHANAAINNECNVESTESHFLLSEWGVPEAPESVPGAKRLQWRLRAALARMEKA